MKGIALAAALLASTAAFAQTTTTTPPADSTTGTMAPTTTAPTDPVPDSAAPAPSGSMGSDSTMTAPQNGSMTNGRAPDSTMSNSGSMGNAGTTGQATASASYPRCSASVTDQCMQGGRPAKRMRRR